MDIWVVAAAAGAGYVAQHWKNFVKVRQSLSDSSCEGPGFAGPKASPMTQQVQDKNCPADAVHKDNKQRQEICSERETIAQDASTAEMAANSRLYDGNLVVFDGIVNNTTYSNPNLLSGRLSNGVGKGDKEEDTVCGHTDETNSYLSLQPSRSDIGVSHGFRQKGSLRSRRSNQQFIRPLSSLESCLMAQLCKEEAEMEEYTFSTIGSPCTPVFRPFLVTDGTRIISRTSNDSFSLPNRSSQNKLYMDACSQRKAKVHGVPPLPSVESMKVRQKTNSQKRTEQSGKLSHSGRKHKKLHGSSQGALLFGIGVSVGIMSSFLANKQEVGKLTELLKQTENLVQDLQEELEMKDSLTVKELAVEDYESQDMQNNALHAFSSAEKHDDCNKEYYDQKANEGSFSKIEAELEAELERLELNMNSCKLEQKLSNVVELDTDDMADVVAGELKADLFGGQDGNQPYADWDGSGTSTPHSAYYAVSPRELSLRLHKVIESRLEQRIEELEIALQNSKRKVRIMESEQVSRWGEFSNNESESSSMQGSPVAKQHNSHADQPVVINLSGNALDAYSEAYDEFSKMNDIEEEEEKPLGSKDSIKQQPLQTFDQNTSWSCNWVQNGNSHRSSFAKTRSMLFPPSQNGRYNRAMSNDLISSEHSSDNDHDEMEELLIQHIVEKARQGSPVVLNAQKVLFSSDET